MHDLKKNASNPKCDRCQKLLEKTNKRKALCNNESYEEFLNICEEDWENEVFSKICSEQKHILPCNTALETRNKEISLAIFRLGGKDGLRKQNKSEEKWL